MSIRPLSRAYNSLDTSGGEQTVTNEEAQISKQAYMKNDDAKAKSVSACIKEHLRKSIAATNIFASTDIDASMKKIDAEEDIPKSLVKAY
jgi:hypothetical protein